MIEGKIVTPSKNYPFKITFEDNKKTIEASNKVETYLKSIDDLVDTRPAGELLEVKFDEASERELVLYFLLKSEYNLDSYPDNIELMDPGPVDEDTLV